MPPKRNAGGSFKRPVTSHHRRLTVQVDSRTLARLSGLIVVCFGRFWVLQTSWESEFASMSDLPCSRQRTTKIHLAEIGW